MKTYWERIEKWLENNAPDIGKSLQKEASDLEIKNLEIAVNAKLPDDFVRFYKCHNGQISGAVGLINGEELLSIERILEEWKVWKDLYDSAAFDDMESSPDKEIKNVWYNLLWIPITSDYSGNHFCLDLDPTSEGACGQVIRVWHAQATRTLKASSFEKWISYFVEDLEDGRYEFEH